MNILKRTRIARNQKPQWRALISASPKTLATVQLRDAEITVSIKPNYIFFERNMSSWTEIEQAPRDGRELVVTDFCSPPQFARWVASAHYVEGGCWMNRNERQRELPTHFLELPKAQSIDKSTKKLSKRT